MVPQTREQGFDSVGPKFLSDIGSVTIKMSWNTVIPWHMYLQKGIHTYQVQKVALEPEIMEIQGLNYLI